MPRFVGSFSKHLLDVLRAALSFTGHGVYNDEKALGPDVWPDPLRGEILGP